MLEKESNWTEFIFAIKNPDIKNKNKIEGKRGLYKFPNFLKNKIKTKKIEMKRTKRKTILKSKT